jgi:hypothetical protein
MTIGTQYSVVSQVNYITNKSFWVSFMLSVANKPFVLSVDILIAIMLSVVAPCKVVP